MMNVLVLAGGKSNEREVSLRSGAAVAEALAAKNYAVVQEDPANMDFDLSTAVNGIDVVFPVLHGAGGEDGKLQAELEKIRKPFVGSGSEASKLCVDKWAYKQFLMRLNLPAASGELIRSSDINNAYFNNPYVLKATKGGSSLDLRIDHKPSQESLKYSMELLQRHGSMLIEPLVIGTEITVGVLGTKALPVIEIVPPEGGDFDFENKYNGATQELCPPHSVSPELQQEAQNLSLKIHELTGCRDLSRTDIIIDKNRKLHVLETNTIPGMTNQSLFPKMAREAGYEMPELVDALVKMALNRSA